MMLGVAVYIVVEAVRRLGQPVEPTSGVMLVVGVVGLAINAVGIILLCTGAGESLNVKGAYLEVMADAVGSVGVIVAGPVGVVDRSVLLGHGHRPGHRRVRGGSF